jgi:Transposase DDE domain
LIDCTSHLKAIDVSLVSKRPTKSAALNVLDHLPPSLVADAVETMKHRLKTPEGRAIYAGRKCTVEPVFGIIKSVLGFRQFQLRGLKAVSSEWTLVSIAWNLKRMFSLQQQKLEAQRA